LIVVYLADFPLRRCPHDFLSPRIWELRNNVTAQDGAPGHRARIELA
jgi:hypothetical protein